MEKKYNSITEEAKVLINGFMDTVNGECERKEIVAYVKENIGDKETLTDGILAGAIKIMVSNNELVVVNRARYRKGVKMASLSLKDKVITLFENFQKDLNRACTINVLEMNGSDMQFITGVNELSNRLEVEIWTLGDMPEDKAEKAEKTDKAEKADKATEEPAKANKKESKATPV